MTIASNITIGNGIIDLHIWTFMNFMSFTLPIGANLQK